MDSNLINALEFSNFPTTVALRETQRFGFFCFSE